MLSSSPKVLFLYLVRHPPDDVVSVKQIVRSLNQTIDYEWEAFCRLCREDVSIISAAQKRLLEPIDYSFLFFCTSLNIVKLCFSAYSLKASLMPSCSHTFASCGLMTRLSSGLIPRG